MRSSEELNKDILRDTIKRDNIGSKLTIEALEKATDFASSVWKGQMGSGEAAKIGIKHVTENILKGENN